jgi:thioredoxin reductase
MNILELKKAYDIILIGSSPITIIEAVNQNRNGKLVLIIEKNPNISYSKAKNES